MTVLPFILVDPDEAIEVIFDNVVDSMNKTFSNEVTNFRRYSDGAYESFVSGVGSRELSVVVRSNAPSSLRRRLDYLRREGKHLILLLGAFDFASEVVIKDFKMIDNSSGYYHFDINFACFGDSGQMRTVLDSRCTGITPVIDSNAIDGHASILDAQNEFIRFEITAGDIEMPASEYMVIARAKSTAGIDNDLIVRAYDSTDAADVIAASHQVDAAGYTYYISEGAITSSEYGHTIQIEAKKATTSTNELSIDLLAYIQSSQNIVVSNPPTSTTVVLSPSLDNVISSASPTTIYSSGTYLDIGASGSNVKRDLLQFDLSSIPSTANISSATLSLYWYYPAGATRTNDTNVGVYRPRYTWDTSYACWTNRVSATAWVNAGGDWYDSTGTAQGSTPFASKTFTASIVPDNAYHDWDVTALVQAYVAGTYSNFGFLLKASTENSNYIAFYSSESSNAAMRPKLTITYT